MVNGLPFQLKRHRHVPGHKGDAPATRFSERGAQLRASCVVCGFASRARVRHGSYLGTITEDILHPARDGW